jgi:hypothetical protein
MRIDELVEILRGFRDDWEIELTIVAPIDDDAEEFTLDRYSIEGVLPWEDDEDGATRLWLVGGEDENVDAFFDAIDGHDDDGSGGDGSGG